MEKESKINELNNLKKSTKNKYLKKSIQEKVKILNNDKTVIK